MWYFLFPCVGYLTSQDIDTRQGDQQQLSLSIWGEPLQIRDPVAVTTLCASPSAWYDRLQRLASLSKGIWHACRLATSEIFTVQ